MLLYLKDVLQKTKEDTFFNYFFLSMKILVKLPVLQAM